MSDLEILLDNGFLMGKIYTTVVQILMYSQVHESIIVQINGDECRSHEEVDFNSL